MLYNRIKIELVFYKNGKSVDGHHVLELAPFCFAEIESCKNFVMTLPHNIHWTSSYDYDIDIVGIHVLPEKRGIPIDKMTVFKLF